VVRVLATGPKDLRAIKVQSTPSFASEVKSEALVKFYSM
jgi:hypothetical protein